MKPSTFLILVVAACGLVLGCETVDRAVLVQQVTPASTNSAGVITQARTNFAVRPEIETGIAVVGALPTPYTAIGSVAASLLFAGYAAFRNSRNKKVAKAVIAGAQEYKNTLNAADSKEFTTILADKQEAAGVRGEVNKLRGKL